MGIVLTVLGLVMMVLLWPMVPSALTNTYSDFENLPDNEDMVEGNTYSVMGKVTKERQIGDYTIMIIECSENDYIYFDKEEFKKGDTVLVQFTVEDEDKLDNKYNLNEESDSDAEEEFKMFEGTTREQMDLLWDFFVTFFEELGFESKVITVPKGGGIAGLALMIIGIILIPISFILFRQKPAGAPGRRAPPQQYQAPAGPPAYQQQPPAYQGPRPPPPPPVY